MNAPLTAPVSTTTGPVVGLRREHDDVFYSIPYAAAPSGPLLCQPPHPHEPWTTPRQCLRPGATAKQEPVDDGAISEPAIPGTEILAATVYRPQDCHPDAQLPVLVYIHGGGFTGGSPAAPAYDGSAYTARGLIVVTIGYRIGLAGFAPLTDSADYLGCLDWLAALSWVKDNIAQFGGNPDNVTIMGQSAGGGAVLWLCGDPRADGLFQRAISLSPSLPLFTRPRITRRLQLLVRATPTAQAIAQLTVERRRRIEDRLAALQLAGVALGPTDTQPPRPGIPLLIGATSDEMLRVPAARRIDSLPPALRTAMVRILLPQFRPHRRNAAALLRTYPDQPAGRAASDGTIRRFVPQAATDRPGTWVYELRFPGPSRAQHCVDLPLVFGHMVSTRARKLIGETPPTRLAADMQNSIERFVRTGDPGWPEYSTSESARPVAVWDSDAPFRVEQGVYDDVAALWPLWPHVTATTN